MERQWLVDLAARCRDLRLLLGKTQREVADEIGYTRQNISLFELGKNPSLDILMWYVRHGLVLEVNADETADGQGIS